MEPYNEKIAASLKILHDLQTKEKSTVFQSSQFTRMHRDRLLKYGFLSEVIKGWLIVTDPSSTKGDSTTWYPSFWRSEEHTSELQSHLDRSRMPSSA